MQHFTSNIMDTNYRAQTFYYLFGRKLGRRLWENRKHARGMTLGSILDSTTNTCVAAILLTIKHDTNKSTIIVLLGGLKDKHFSDRDCDTLDEVA